MKEKDQKEKLADWILMEAEELKNPQSLTATSKLAEELTRDAIALAKLVKEERNVA